MEREKYGLSALQVRTTAAFPPGLATGFEKPMLLGFFFKKP